jgi:hypothetical protein
MVPNVVTEVAYRAILAAIDLGWTPPAWRSAGPAFAPPADAANWLRTVARAIQTQRQVR